MYYVSMCTYSHWSGTYTPDHMLLHCLQLSTKENLHHSMNMVVVAREHVGIEYTKGVCVVNSLVVLLRYSSMPGGFMSAVSSVSRI